MSDKAPQYIETDELTISLHTELFDPLLLTERDFKTSPVINAEADTLDEKVVLHMPFVPEWEDDQPDDIAFAENLVHTQLTLEQAENFLEQLQSAVNELEPESDE